MSFNQYSIYSVISVTEGHNTEDIQKVLSISENLKQIKTAEKAKEFIKSKFDINEPVSDYPIGNNATISISEDEKLYSINLVFSNENLTYTFVK